jgi:hypothetical protein
MSPAEMKFINWSAFLATIPCQVLKILSVGSPGLPVQAIMAFDHVCKASFPLGGFLA